MKVKVPTMPKNAEFSSHADPDDYFARMLAEQRAQNSPPENIAMDDAKRQAMEQPE